MKRRERQLVSSLRFILQLMLYVAVALETPIPAPAGVVLVIFSHTLAVRLVKGRLSPPSKRIIRWTQEAVHIGSSPPSETFT